MLSQLSKLGGLAAKVWNIITFILPLFEALTNVVQKFEEIEPDDDVKRGAEKKEAVVKFILVIYDLVNDVTEEELPVPRSGVASFANKTIDIVVATLNAFGVFK